MSSLTVLISIFSFILISYAIVFENDPIILVSQGVLKKNGSLPISIFWYHPNITENDSLLVYSSNPQRKWKEYYEIELYTGFYELSHTTVEQDENLDNYCAVILTKDGTLDGNPSCESKVQWMYDRRDLLREFSLRDLVIPGTHQSAAYTKSYDGSLNHQSFISGWLFCQTKSIKSQLIDGIRYLDLRPGYIYNEGKKNYVVTHNMISLIPMDDVVTQINEFMDISKDIVIVSFKEFAKGFNSDKDHQEFIQYLIYSFYKHAQPRRWWTRKLKEFWAEDLRLVLSYDHHAYWDSATMWPPITQYWGNVQTINGLHSYLDPIHRKDWNITDPYAAMVELTHSVVTIIQDTFQGGMGLAQWAERLSRFIPRWYTEEWASMANIIAVDFYQTSGIVDLSIQLNERIPIKSRSNLTTQ